MNNKTKVVYVTMLSNKSQYSFKFEDYKEAFDFIVKYRNTKNESS